MGTRPRFQNWQVDAYLEGRLDEIPAELLEVVKDIAERRNKAANMEIGVRLLFGDGDDKPVKLKAGDVLSKDELTQLVVDHIDEG